MMAASFVSVHFRSTIVVGHRHLIRDRPEEGRTAANAASPLDFPLALFTKTDAIAMKLLSIQPPFSI
jgi:hypothetical protein